MFLSTNISTSLCDKFSIQALHCMIHAVVHRKMQYILSINGQHIFCYFKRAVNDC